jgi:hypothetical protein
MAQKKETKKDKKVQVRDLKPKKDAKGGGGTGFHGGRTDLGGRGGR